MAYEWKMMRRIDGVPGQQQFHYKTTDTATTVKASGYFNDAVNDFNLDTGDVIIATSGAEGAAAVDLLVAKNTNGTVTVVASA
ncbi:MULTISPECIES: hypothetical protein [unclassified Maridesulfovibrio]|uniref:hypothetical protein n=1 Tax=unclassified Maridesulfovibrio TaxID=2794999 RepID=UPI003B3CBF31